MALYPKGDRPYTFGLSQCSYPRVWTAQDERLLQEIGRRVEDALTSLLIFRTLRQSEHKLEDAQRIAHVGHWEGDLLTSRFTYSDETYRIFGLRPDERVLTFDDVQTFVHPADRSRRAAAIETAVQGGPGYDVEYRLVRPTGEIRIVRSRGEVRKDELGRPRFVFGIMQDITARQRVAQRLVAQSAVTRILAESMTLQDATTKILRSVCETLDWDVGTLWSVDAVAGVLRCVETWHTESIRAQDFEAASRARTFPPAIGLPGRVWSTRAPLYIRDAASDPSLPRSAVAAREGLHTAFGFPILLRGDVVGVMEFFSGQIRRPDEDELTTMSTIGSQIGQFIERKRAEAALRASEATLAEGEQISQMGSWRWNLRTGELYESAEHTRIYGFDPSTGPRSHRHIRERLHPDDRATIEQILDAAVRARRAFDCEGRIVGPDGVVKHLHVVGRPVIDASGQLEYVGTIQDITDRKQAELRIAAQYTVAQALAAAATIEEAAPNILRALCECLEWDVGALWRLDRTAELMRCVDVWRKESLDGAEFEAYTRTLTLKPGVGIAGQVWVARGPVHVPDVTKWSYVESDPTSRVRPAAVRAGLHSRCGFPILLGDEVLGAISFYSREIREPDPELLNVMATVGIQLGQFIERKQADEALHRAQVELTHVTRVATLGELTASIAHEINQPLGAVVNNASACVRWLAAQNLEEARRSAALVIADGHRAGQIISRIRALAANVPPQRDRLDLEATIQDEIAFARSEAHRHSVALDTDFAEGLSPILGDRIQLQQVVLNLVMNAIEAMSGGDWAPRAMQVANERAASGEVVVAVRDSGPGFDPEHIDRLFDAFYTTKTQGLGLGLAISRRIIEAHGGRLWATANTPRGAVFQFTLPGAETPTS